MSCITEILKLKGDKEAFVPPRDWIAVEGGGTYEDHEYLVVLNRSGHRCGYVAIHPEHKYSQTPEIEISFMGSRTYKDYDYNSLDIECHGGLTFMSPNHGLKDLLDIPCNDMWIGFDCGHYRDLPDIEAFKKYFSEEKYKSKETYFSIMSESDDPIQSVKDFAYVEKECKSIIDQLIKVA